MGLPTPCAGQRTDSADPDEPTMTTLSHAAHFLSRTLRCEGEDLSRAMRLYHHSDLLRRLVPELLADQPEVSRAAIPLRDEQPSAHVIVTRDGRFVTCLDESMYVDLPLLPHQKIEAQIAAEDLARGRSQRARRQLAELPGPELTNALLGGYGHVTREMVQVLLIDPSTYMQTVLKVFIEIYKNWVKVCQARPFHAEPRLVYRRQLELEATCRLCVPLLGTMDTQPLTEYLVDFLAVKSTLELDLVMALCRHSGGGEALLQALSDPEVAPGTRAIITTYIGTHLVYFPRHAPALLPRIRAMPLLETDSDFHKHMRELYDSLLAVSEEEMVALYEQQRRAPPSPPPPASRHYEICELDYRRAVNKALSVTRLFPEAAVAGDARARWARSVHDRPLPPKERTGIRPVIRGAPKVGRNDPCPCGSGRKHKQCCLVRPREAEQPAEPSSSPDLR